MGKLETTLKSEIARLARREARAMADPLAKNIRQLKKQVRSLNAEVERLSRKAGKSSDSTKAPVATPAVSEDELKNTRISPGLIKKLRKRLTITQRELAALAGVSAAAVQSWEQGIVRPRGANLATLVALRGLNPAAAAKHLADKGIQPAKRRPRV